MYLYVFGFAQSFELFTSSFDVGNHQGYVPVCNVVDMVVFLIGAAVVPGVVVRLVVVEELLVPLVECPVWELASLQCCFDVL